MTNISSSLRSRARSWAELDPNPITRDHVLNLLEKIDESRRDDHHAAEDEKEKELQDLFLSDGSRIGFGTAGLRSTMKPGPHGMNDLVVVQTAQGLARYCQQESETTGDGDGDQNRLKAVVGYDHRSNPTLSLSSRKFALLTKLVFDEAGFDCLLLDGYVPTPLVPFATTRLGAAVGIMVTASHNPKLDAGYKVYWKDGCQIRPPLDADIAESIVCEENLTPWMDYGEKMEHRRATYAGSTDDHTSGCLGLSDPHSTVQLADAYFAAILSSGLVTGQAKFLNNRVEWKPPGVAYTAMHGVGCPWAARSFRVFGLEPFQPVPIQQEPDFSFPTVAFPNPEEKGALDCSIEFSEKNKLDLILANDPDADRLAVAERCRASGEWTVFHGDQIGTMLGHWLWESIGKKCNRPVAMCASTVSSSMLSTIAKKEGFHFEDTLTGFKWIGSRATALRSKGYRVLFSYEEAIGYCCGDVVADKDGISAAGVMTELSYHVYRQGKNLAQHMKDLYEKYGEFVSNNGYYYCYDPSVVQKIFEEIRNGGQYMERVGPYQVESIRDLGSPGFDSTKPDCKPTLPTSSSSPMITLRFTNGCCAHFRASGTEPKFKYYIEMAGKPGAKRDVVVEQLSKMSYVLLEELLHPASNGLVTPSRL